MKKIFIASTLALAASLSFAGNVTVSAVNDYTADKTGYRIETSALKFGPINQVSFTHVDGKYNRVAVGGEFALAKVAGVSLSATGAGVYQDSKVKGAVDGYGISVGAKASAEVMKGVSLVASAERFFGQSRVSKSEGNTVGVGVSVKF